MVNVFADAQSSELLHDWLEVSQVEQQEVRAIAYKIENIVTKSFQHPLIPFFFQGAGDVVDECDDVKFLGCPYRHIPGVGTDDWYVLDSAISNNHWSGIQADRLIAL